MRTAISLFTFALLCSTTVLAQTQFGVKIGANFGDIKEDIEFNTDLFSGLEPSPYELHITPQVGIWLDLPLTARLSLQPELLWTQKIQESENNNPTESFINFQYFSLPVLAKYKLGKFRIELGPEVSFLLDQSLRNSNGPFDESPFIDENVFEFAVNVGLHYTHNRWTIGARASRDLTHFLEFEFTDGNGDVFGAIRDFHRSGMVWVGYQIL
ncbi:MAG: porin family protein [Bacteroidota bacterium]